MIARLFSVLVFFHTLLAGCGPPRDKRGDATDATDQYDVTLLGRIKKQEMQESSGLTPANPAATEFWTHGDGGSPATLYRVSRTGALLQTLPVPGTRNRDWEALAHDPQDRLYLADCGNNDNARRNLVIYRFDPAHPARAVDTIRFRYPDQYAFPPHKPKRNFDCEAVCFVRDSLYLFTKNRGKGGLLTKHYVVSGRPGSHVASLRDSLELETWVTDASISPDGRTVALLGYGFIYLFEGDPAQRIFDRRRLRIAVKASGQAEAITFVNNTDLVFSNENGKLFAVRKK